MKIFRDKVYLEKKKNLLSTLSFLKAIDSNLPLQKAIEIADYAAANYLITYYEEVFDGTEPASQQRFDRFREHYLQHSLKSSYCEVIESTETYLKVQFLRCPFVEILDDEKLLHFAESSCKSDQAFTEKLLPGVKFNRLSSIVAGEQKCIMEWSK
ncbi:MAG: L-2-amino-thiazoline-4-carboxylic acid hydrolase [Melioribacteraceae bacterium]|jgi:predicted ArsR family transcriptional regulator|nr:MAG: L-2-amino-thiazoline-4-carboxylic acid hydrolase [Melioribacteraceae bacterium]